MKIIIFSQNLVLDSLINNKLLSRSDEYIILTTHALFDNEIKLLKSYFNIKKIYAYADFLSDEEMEFCDVEAYKRNPITQNEYVEEIKIQKNQLVYEKISLLFPGTKGYIASSNDDLGIVDYIWISRGFKRLLGLQFYNKVSNITKLKKSIKKIKFINSAYQKLKKNNAQHHLESDELHVYEDKGYKYILIGRLPRLAYRLSVDFISSQKEVDIINKHLFYSRDKAQYLVPWHENFKSFIPDDEQYDVRWVQDGYLPSNYSDFTYSFKPKNVTYDVWDSNGALLFKNKDLPYDLLPFRKKIYIPKICKRSLKTILVATSATGDWTAQKNRSDDDYLVMAFVKLAKRHPDIKIIYRCHPNWILPNTVGVNSINRLIQYFEYLNLPNLVVSSNIPNAASGNGYIQSFSRSSLDDDLKEADLVFGEHSISMIDASLKGIPFCSINITNRRNLFESITNLGFPHCENEKDLENIIMSFDEDFFWQNYNNAISKYNSMVDEENI